MSGNMPLVASVLIFVVASQVAKAAEYSWYAPLERKAQVLEEQVLRWHWIGGLYPSQVIVPADLGTPDHSTNGESNVMHTCCWTANHLAGESYRYAFIKKTGKPEDVKAARDHVNAIFDGMFSLQKMTGIKGFQARGYLYGHGPTSEERANNSKADSWYQGVGEYKDLRWRGDPSHHNYSDAIHGYGVYFRLAAEGEYKEKCRQAIDNLVSIWADTEDLLIPTKEPGELTMSILGITDGRTPNLRVVMAAAGAKVAHYATGKEKFAEVYERIVKQYGFRKRTKFRRWSPQDTDDAEHVFCHLDNLLNMEKDPELVRFYRVVLDALWDSHKNSRCPLFNYNYLALTPDAPDREKCLADALWTLQSHPTNMFFQPRMNSLRDDMAKHGGYANEPLPVFEAAWDNEYLWKGHLYRLDGWLSRLVVALGVARDDADVLYAADTSNDLYRSGDGAASWQWIGQAPAPGVKKILCGAKRRFVFLMTGNAVFRSLTGGRSWSRLPMPPAVTEVSDVQLDRTNSNRLYVVSPSGVYRSLDFGEDWIGERWECVTPMVPPAHRVQLMLGQGETMYVYGFFDDTLRSFSSETPAWSAPIQIGYGGWVPRYPWLLVEPGNPRSITCGFKLNYRNIDGGEVFKGDVVGTLLTRSEDAGATWTYDRNSVMKMFKEMGAPKLILKAMSELLPHFLEVVVQDPQNPKVMYAATDKSFFVSLNRGRSWKELKDGLDVPKVEGIFAPPAGEKIYAATRAGLYSLRRGEDEWEFANLRLQFNRNETRDLGGAAYLDAYWRGRYFGFITDEQAAQDPSEWNIPEKYRHLLPKAEKWRKERQGQGG